MSGGRTVEVEPQRLAATTTTTRRRVDAVRRPSSSSWSVKITHTKQQHTTQHSGVLFRDCFPPKTTPHNIVQHTIQQHTKTLHDIRSTAACSFVFLSHFLGGAPLFCVPCYYINWKRRRFFCHTKIGTQLRVMSNQRQRQANHLRNAREFCVVSKSMYFYLCWKPPCRFTEIFFLLA